MEERGRGEKKMKRKKGLEKRLQKLRKETWSTRTLGVALGKPCHVMIREKKQVEDDVMVVYLLS